MAGRFTVESIFKAVDRVTAPISRMQNAVGRYTRSVESSMRRANSAINSSFSTLAEGGKTALKWGAIATGAIGGAAAYLIRQFSKIEDAEAAFTPILGGADKARKAVEALNAAAATTPFQFDDLAGAANQLLPVLNGNIDEVIRTIRMLGDTAGGNAQKLDTITRGYTKALLKGKVDMESLNMIAEAGVPIFQDLAEVMGTKVGAKFFKQISAGRVTTEQLTKAFEKLTGKGGKFFEGMEIASRTTSGLWSTLADNVNLLAADLGSVLAPVVKDLITQATVLVGGYREWIKANRDVVSARFMQFVGEAKEVLFAMGRGLLFLSRHGGTITKAVVGVLALIVALKTLVLVMTAVNLVMSLNPIGLIVLGIAAAIAAIAALVIWWDEIKAAFVSLPAPIKVAMAAIMGPIGWMIGAAALIMSNWEPIKGFFTDLWDGIASAFTSAIDRVLRGINAVKRAYAATKSFFGFGADPAEASAPTGQIDWAPQMVSPQARVARTIEETRQTSSAEVTIKDQTGRAEVTRGSLGPLINLQPSGAF